MEEAIAHPDVDIVCISLPTNLHEAAVMMCCKHKKAVMTTKPLGRNGEEAKRMLIAVEEAGIFNGYLEDLVYTPKFIKANQSVKEGALGRVLWAKSRETHPGPHSEWFWDIEQAGGGCILDLGCHCVEISRSYIGKDIKPIEVMCWADTQVKPIDAEDHAIGLVKYENGAIAQFEVSWTFRGGLDLRDEVMGTEGTIWINGFLRTGFEMFTTGKGADYVAEKAETNSGWLFPVGDELNELGYNHMFTEMFNCFEIGTQPRETFYDGYLVNAVLDGRQLAFEDVVTLFDDTRQAIQFSRKILFSTLEHLSQGVSVVDRDLQLVAWNRQYLEMFNYPEGMVRVGRSVADIVRFNAERGLCGEGSAEEHVQKRLQHIQFLREQPILGSPRSNR